MLAIKRCFITLVLTSISSTVFADNYFEYETKSGKYAVLLNSKLHTIYNSKDVEALRDYCLSRTDKNGNWRLLGKDFTPVNLFRKNKNVHIAFDKNVSKNVLLVSGLKKLQGVDQLKRKRAGFKFKRDEGIEVAPICIATIHEGKLQTKRVGPPKLSGVDFNGNVYEQLGVTNADLRIAINNRTCNKIKYGHPDHVRLIYGYISDYLWDKLSEYYSREELNRLSQGYPPGWFTYKDDYREEVLSRLKKLQLDKGDEISCRVKNLNNLRLNNPQGLNPQNPNRKYAENSIGLVKSVLDTFESDSIMWVSFRFMENSGQLRELQIMQSIPGKKVSSKRRKEIIGAYNLKWAEAISRERGYFWKDINSQCSIKIDGNLTVNCLGGKNSKYQRDVEMPLHEIPGGKAFLQEVNKLYLNKAITFVHKQTQIKKEQEDDIVY